MSDDEIKGRNLILRGNFPADWKNSWTHDGVGNAVIQKDESVGNYVAMNSRAKVEQKMATPTFSESQMTGVAYRIAFMYENYLDGENSKVVVITSKGKESIIDLSGRIANQPLADWNYYDLNKLDDFEAGDTDFTVQLHGSSKAGTAALRMVNVEVDVKLVPLALKTIQLDDRVYQPQSRRVLSSS
ncbi:hypothetical protein [Pseudomonas sp. GV085]|uniref:hypothetical protein n=1 Tax=Pseudomonas sp. GV085 TaxID=2135756 RepID=UPI000D38D886|nr:hypothetical protein [Pseudomonas sp. GV085]PTR29405.1 hypothetical protein C8K63_101288 [Pseudomonas sp. GV085]